MASWKEIQEQLIALGYDLGPSGADGDPGRFTREAIQKFQAERKIPVINPGSVGPKTLAALFPGSLPKPAPVVSALLSTFDDITPFKPMTRAKTYAYLSACCGR